MRIIRVVDKRINTALGRTGEHWRALNACPCCCYKVSERFFEHSDKRDTDISIA